MSFSVPDILPAIIDTLEADSAITADVPLYQGSAYNIHTRRPAPSDASKPYILVGPYINVNDLTTNMAKPRFEITLDLAIYGDQSTGAEYRKVERIGRNIFAALHRQPDKLTVNGYHVGRIQCSGPIPAPADDDTIVGRLVTTVVTIQAT